MTANHAHFAALCALAASGQLTQTELAELRGHARVCPSCRRRIAELNEVGALLFLADSSAHSYQRPPKGMRDRFVTRAISEGVPLSIRSSPTEVRRLGTAAAIILGMLVIAVAHRRGALPVATQSIERASVASTHVDPPFRGEPADVAVAAPTLVARQVASTRYPQRKSLMRTDSMATAMVLPDTLRSSPPLFRSPTFQLNSRAKKGNSPGLLAECEDCTFIASARRPEFALALSTDELHRGILDPDAFNSKPLFRLDPTALHLIQNVVIDFDQNK
jgi:hypothetical protein